MLYWDYETPESRTAGAIAPERLSLAYGERAPDSPYADKSYASRWRAIEEGYVTQPGDCPPVRLIAHYGYAVRCPGKVRLRRLEQRLGSRDFKLDCARFGIAEVGGDIWPQSDSGFIASWIAGSEFVKIQTGIVVYFRADHYLYQGPLPNTALSNLLNVEVMAGLEQAVESRRVNINGNQYGYAQLNIIVRLPPVGSMCEIETGDLLAWFFPVPGTNSITLERMTK